MRRATKLGRPACVIHTAGLSTQMADAQTIMTVNALGTVNVTRASYRLATDGFALVNLASMAAHIFPALMLPRGSYPLALSRPESFVGRALRLAQLMPRDFYRSAMAYGISKDFVIWLSSACAGQFGEKGRAHRVGLARLVRYRDGTPRGKERLCGNAENGGAETLRQAGRDRRGPGFLREREGRLPDRHGCALRRRCLRRSPGAQATGEPVRHHERQAAGTGCRGRVRSGKRESEHP